MSDRVVDRTRPTLGSAATLAEAGSGALTEARRTVQLVGEELAAFRRRALQAEARIRELEEQVRALEGRVAAAEARPAGDEELTPREAELTQQNARLRSRLDAGTQRIAMLLERMRFIREQGSAVE